MGLNDRSVGRCPSIHVRERIGGRESIGVCWRVRLGWRKAECRRIGESVGDGEGGRDGWGVRDGRRIRNGKCRSEGLGIRDRWSWGGRARESETRIGRRARTGQIGHVLLGQDDDVPRII